MTSGAQAQNLRDAAEAGQPVVYRPLGAFRLFLALLVVLQHYVQWIFPGALQRQVMPWAPGSTAVLVFFFISGFVIVEAVDRFYAGRPGAFIVNRIIRIAPLYILAMVASWIVLMVLAHWSPATDQHGGRAPTDAFGVRNLAANLLSIVPLPGRWQPEPSFKLLQIAWALRVEMAFYISVAMVVAAAAVVSRLLRRADQARATLAILLGAAAAVALAAFAYYVMKRPGWNDAVIFVPEFCAGGAFYFALRPSKIAMGVLLLSLIACSIAVGGIGGSAEALQGGASRMLALFLALVGLAVGLVLWARPAARLLRADKVLGDYSYPLYVGHWLPILVFASWSTTFLVPVAFKAVALVFAGLLPVSYFLIVEPSTRRLRDLVRGRKL